MRHFSGLRTAELNILKWFKPLFSFAFPIFPAMCGCNTSQFFTNVIISNNDVRLQQKKLNTASYLFKMQ